jgi:signal transduction histidine kinase
VLAPRGALPVLGPLAATLAAGGLQTDQLTDGLTSYGVSVLVQYRLTTSAVLLYVAAAAVGGLGFAQVLTNRRAERKQAEQIRREAAIAERERLARPIHDGVLQVLALVQRYGAELGGQGGQLAALAGEQEVALRSLLTGNAGVARNAAEDLRAPLQALATASVEIATPAEPVSLPAVTSVELVAAVRAALDNVARHAGDGARAWVLLEDEGDGVRVTVRDDGVGFAPERLAEAEGAGRLGVAQSMRGRIADRGGVTTIVSRPGEGTEVEFWVPRVPPAASKP